MRHPALTRVFSVVLVLLCLTMGMAGGLGLTRAEKDREAVLADMSRLRGRIEEYREATESLKGTESFDARSESLDERQKQHDKGSSEHRVELTTFTATRYGLNMGTEAMDQANRQFAEYKALFEQGMGTIQPVMSEASALLVYLWQIYFAAAEVVDNANAHLAFASGFTAGLDAGEELTVGTVVAAYDELLRCVDETAALYDTLHELQPALDTLALFDPASLTSLADSVPEIPASLGGMGDLSLDAYTSAGVDVPFDMEQLGSLKESYNSAWATVKAAMAEIDALIPELDNGVRAMTGMGLAEIRQGAQTARDELAAQSGEPLDPAFSQAILDGYAANSGEVHAALDEAAAGMGTVNSYLAQARELLSTVQGQVDALIALMGLAQDMINEGEQALYWARAAIWLRMGEQEKKEEELREQKEQLTQEAEELEILSEQAEEQKTAEQRQRSLRAILLSREEIRQRSDAGEELAAAATAYAEESEQTAQTVFQTRRRACLLMLSGAALALLGLPAAFEAIRSRFMLLFPVLLCLGCAAAAEVLFVRMGRGHSYSALAAAGAALLQLTVSLPRAKIQKGGKHLV